LFPTFRMDWLPKLFIDISSLMWRKIAQAHEPDQKLVARVWPTIS
jgi:hypothetical protein